MRTKSHRSQATACPRSVEIIIPDGRIEPTGLMFFCVFGKARLGVSFKIDKLMRSPTDAQNVKTLQLFNDIADC